MKGVEVVRCKGVGVVTNIEVIHSRSVGGMQFLWSDVSEREEFWDSLSCVASEISSFTSRGAKDQSVVELVE